MEMMIFKNLLLVPSAFLLENLQNEFNKSLFLFTSG